MFLSVTDFSFPDYPLYSLRKIHGLSVRAKNVCARAGLTSLYKILEWHQENKNFKQLYQCGSKTEKELNEIVKKYLTQNQNQYPIEVRIHNSGYAERTDTTLILAGG